MSVKLSQKGPKTGGVSLTLTVGNVKNAVKSYIFSKRFINIIAKTAVLNIMFHRIPVDENEFILKKFHNVEYRMFRSKSKNPLIRNYHSYMQGFKDALDKSFLKEVYLYFIDAETDEILENYKFSLTYTEDKENAPIHNPPATSNSLMESTVDFLRALEDLGSHPKLEGNVIMKMEFTYFHDTPLDYQPPGYEDVDPMKAYGNKVSKVGNSVVLGNLLTGFHKLKCRGRGNIFNDLRVSQVTTELNTMMDCYDVEPMNIEEPHESVIKLPEDNAIVRCTSNPRELLQSSQSAISIISDEEDQDTENLNCICDNCNISYEVIRCVQCKKTSHLSCQGYLDRSYVKQPFKCYHCNGGDDILSKNVTANKLPVICKIRFILATLFRETKLPKSVAVTFEKTLQHLQEIKYIRTEEDGTIRTVEAVFRNFFDFRYKPLSNSN